MGAMTTALLTEAVQPISELAVQLNAHLKTQRKERTLDRLDQCDRCPQAAQAVFVFKVEGGTNDILLCGHHLRQYLPALLAKEPVSYWVDPGELYTFLGVNAPEPSVSTSGDGLTDA